MILPSKIVRFEDSILAKTVYILDNLYDSDYYISDLYKKVENHFIDINEFIVAIDVLFVLEKIIFDEELKVIKYVKTN